MTTLHDLHLYKENDKYYLSASIVFEDKRGVCEASIPKIRLPIAREPQINVYNYSDEHKPDTEVIVDFGFGDLYDERADGNNYYTIKYLEEKVHKMTLAEIEKELGYKIELKEEN